MKKVFPLLFFCICSFLYGQKPQVVITTGHTDQVFCMDYNFDGSFLATGGGANDKLIKIWDISSNKELRSLGPNNGAINYMKFHRSKNLLMSFDFGGKLKIWDVEKGVLLIERNTNTLVKPDFCLDDDHFCYLDNKYNIIVESMKDKTTQTAFSGLFCNSMTVFPDQKRVALTNLSDSTISIVDLTTGMLQKQFQGHRAPLAKLSISPNGKYASLSVDLTHTHFYLYNLEKGTLIKKVKGHKVPVVDHQFLNDETLITYDFRGHLISWNVNSLKKNYTSKIDSIHARRMDIHPDKQTIVSTGFNSLLFYSAKTGKPVNVIKANANKIQNLVYDHKGRYVATSHFETHAKNIKIWDLHQNKIAGSLMGFFPVAFHPDGGKIVYMYNHLEMHMYDLEKKKVVSKIPTNGNLIQNLAFSDDGTQLSGGDFTGIIKIWDLEANKIVQQLKGHIGGVYGTDFNSKSNLLVSGGMDNVVRIWDVKKGKELHKLEGHTLIVNDVEFSPDDQTVASGAWDKSIKIWDVKSGQLLKTFTGHTDKVLSISYNEDGTRLASSAGNSTVNKADNSIKIWEVSTGKELCQLAKHTNQVSDVVFEHHNNQLISGSIDAKMILWDGNTCSSKATYLALGVDDYLVMTPEHYYTASKGALQGVGFRVGTKMYGFDQFDIRLNRPDIVASKTGKSPQILIDAYYEAYKKRLKKLKFTEDMIGKDFHVPELKVDKKDLPVLTAEKFINFSIEATDSKYTLNRINVYVNEVPVYGTTGIDVSTLKKQSLQKDIRVDLMSGRNVIQVSVLNNKGAESLKETFEIIREGNEKGDLYLIEIDVSHYLDSSFNLQYPGKDAKDFRTKIESNSAIYNKIHEIELKDSMVTLENFNKLYDFVKNAGVDDVIIFYIVGHGVLDEKLDYYYGTYDIDFHNSSARGLSYDEIEAFLASLKSFKKLLIMDTCHSGEVEKDEVEKTDEKPVEKGKVKFRHAGITIKEKTPFGLYNSLELSKHLFADLRKGTGATVISSAGGAEFAFEGEDWENGLFTYCLLNGMTYAGGADLNHDGMIMISELKKYVYDKVTALSDGKQKPTARQENLLLDFRVW